MYVGAKNFTYVHMYVHSQYPILSGRRMREGFTPPPLSVGKATERDLEVLLSERAAKEIYKKWVDTLQVCVCVCVCVYIERLYKLILNHKLCSLQSDVLIRAYILSSGLVVRGKYNTKITCRYVIE